MANEINLDVNITLIELFAGDSCSSKQILSLMQVVYTLTIVCIHIFAYKIISVNRNRVDMEPHLKMDFKVIVFIRKTLYTY